jgi:hypothetical protein
MRNILIITLILAAFALSSCSQESLQESNQRYYESKYQVFIIDSCEYVYFSGGNHGWGSHKGNCKFCKLRNQTK